MEKNNLLCSDEEEIIIQEFKTSSPGRRRMPKKNKLEEYRKYVILGVFALIFLLAVLTGMLLDLPVVLVCVVLVVEVLIGACLHGAPVWLHGLEIIIGMTAGGVFGKLGFMVIASLIYLLAVFVLYLLGKQVEG